LGHVFGPVLRQLRIDKNMTQEVLGGLVGVSSPYISMMESGHNYPSLEMIFQLAVALEIRPSGILREMENRLRWGEAVN
jgi:transcriptional regulator with XRE-family HTH domain